MFKKKSTLPSFLLLHCFLILAAAPLWISTTSSTARAEAGQASGPVVRKQERLPVVSTEHGEISAVRISDGIDGSYLLHFFKLEPDSLLLPVVLNADMIFYVHSGSGKLSWAERDELEHIDLRQGDVFKLQRGTVFFIRCRSDAQADQQRLRIHAIFATSNDDLREPAIGAYSSIQDMVLGFDRKVLQATFKASEEAIDDVLGGAKPPAIVHVDPTWEMDGELASGILKRRRYNVFELNKKKKKKEEQTRLFNFFEEEKDYENCNGWISTVTRKKVSALKGSDVGLFMLNLNAGSMMGPHWNSIASEIAVVMEGRGMVRVVCSSISKETDCGDVRFEVEEGDVFAVPRFHGASQMAFNDGPFAIMGFSTVREKKQALFLGGDASVLRVLDRDVLALTFNVTNTTVSELLAPKEDSIITGCTSCAEEELQVMEEGGGGEEEEEGGDDEGEPEDGGGGSGERRWSERGRRIGRNKRLTI